MNFSQVLNYYINQIGCTAKELSDCSGLSCATISRYRAGERIPAVDSREFDRLCDAVAQLSEAANKEKLTKKDVEVEFLSCPDIVATDRRFLKDNLNTLISALDVNITQMCKKINYEPSAFFRIRNGSRQPSEPMKFAENIALYIADEYGTDEKKAALAEILECDKVEIASLDECAQRLKIWLIKGHKRNGSDITEFLEKLNVFDLNEYIKAIHFDEIKVPSVPFQLPTSKVYEGVEEFKNAELDFLKATVLSKSEKPVIFFSNMPMEEMAKDLDFSKKWMFGMAVMLRKGLHLNMIHNIDRPFAEMMLGLESWIPLYMTGQVSPYYFKGVQNNVFLTYLNVSGSAALSGEAIADNHGSGRYRLVKAKEDVAYYRKRAEDMLSKACPLMEIYREENEAAFNAFLTADLCKIGKRRRILSSLPLCTLSDELLNSILNCNGIDGEKAEKIRGLVAREKETALTVMKTDEIEEEFVLRSREMFDEQPITLTVSQIFAEDEIKYSYEQYQEHLRLTQAFAAEHERYVFRQTSAQPFDNLQIVMHEGEWAMISKNKSPAVHFVIRHPKLRAAIESFIPPVIE